MTTININEDERNRALEVLLYKKGGEAQKKEEPVLRKFNLKKVFSLFQRELVFQVELVIKKKDQLSGGKKC